MSAENDRLTTLYFSPEMGKRLFYARRKINLKQVECAKLLGISQTALSKLESGKVKLSRVTIETFKLVFKKHYAYILTGKKPLEYEYLYGRIDAGVNRTSWKGGLTFKQYYEEMMQRAARRVPDGKEYYDSTEKDKDEGKQ